MGRVIKLKRSDVQGKVPTTANLVLGELALNSFDGKLFFKKNNGTDSIQSIVTTNADITGSVNLIGALTSSLLVVDNESPSTNIFLVRINEEDKVRINDVGTFIIEESTTLPSGEEGGFGVSGSNFFIYL